MTWRTLVSGRQCCYTWWDLHTPRYTWTLAGKSPQPSPKIRLFQKYRATQNLINYMEVYSRPYTCEHDRRHNKNVKKILFSDPLTILFSCPILIMLRLGNLTHHASKLLCLLLAQLPIQMCMMPNKNITRLDYTSDYNLTGFNSFNVFTVTSFWNARW